MISAVHSCRRWLVLAAALVLSSTAQMGCHKRYPSSERHPTKRRPAPRATTSARTAPARRKPPALKPGCTNSHRRVKICRTGQTVIRFGYDPPPNYEFSVTVHHRGRRVLHKKSFRPYWIGSRHNCGAETCNRRQWDEQRRLKLGKDITGDGVPNMVLYQDGKNWSFEMGVYSLGTTFRRLLWLEFACSTNFVDLNKDGRLEIIHLDPVFAYWKACSAGSAYGRVVFEFKNGRYTVAAALMRKNAPTAAWAYKKAGLLRKHWNNPKYFEFASVTILTQVLVKLIYAGKARLAWKVLSMAVPPKAPGMKNYKQEFIDNLNESKFWKGIKRTNGGAL